MADIQQLLSADFPADWGRLVREPGSPLLTPSTRLALQQMLKDARQRKDLDFAIRIEVRLRFLEKAMNGIEEAIADEERIHNAKVDVMEAYFKAPVEKTGEALARCKATLMTDEGLIFARWAIAQLAQRENPADPLYKTRQFIRQLRVQLIEDARSAGEDAAIERFFNQLAANNWGLIQ